MAHVAPHVLPEAGINNQYKISFQQSRCWQRYGLSSIGCGSISRAEDWAEDEMPRQLHAMRECTLSSNFQALSQQP
ncbi:hypothetical protein WJX82_006479 [Trebouxia sp. C0006]